MLVWNEILKQYQKTLAHRNYDAMNFKLVQSVEKYFCKLRDLIRVNAHDSNTPKGRAGERHRRITLTAIASSLSKIISIATILISVPLTLRYLGPERFGMWATISSLSTFLAFADLGIGNGMLTAIATAHGRKDHAAIRGYISSGFYLLSAISIVLLCIFSLVYQILPLNNIFNIKSEIAKAEIRPAVAAFFVGFLLSIPLTVVQRVQMALQQGFLSSLWQCAASILGLVGLLICVHYEAGLPWLVMAMIGSPLITNVLNNIIFFKYMQPDIAPNWGACTATTALRIIRAGGLFFILQVVAALAYASDSLIIAHIMGVSAVAEFSVPERMFSVVTIILTTVLAPLWPAYGEAIARGDLKWVRQTLKRSIIIAAIAASMFSITLVLTGPWLIANWVGKIMIPSFDLLIAFAIWKTIEAIGNSLATFLNGAHIVGLQVAMAIFTALSAVILKFVLIESIGIAGGLWASIISYALLTALPVIYFMPRIFKELQARQFT
jgi:O-antigen/teichoic acid export membrane protein